MKGARRASTLLRTKLSAFVLFSRYVPVNVRNSTVPRYSKIQKTPRALHSSYLAVKQFPSAPRPSEQEETVTQRYRRRAWSVLIVIGSVLTAAAIWKSPPNETRGR